jgi:hypothetical protein
MLNLERKPVILLMLVFTAALMILIVLRFLFGFVKKNYDFKRQSAGSSFPAQTVQPQTADKHNEYRKLIQQARDDYRAFMDRNKRLRQQDAALELK